MSEPKQTIKQQVMKWLFTLRMVGGTGPIGVYLDLGGETDPPHDIDDMQGGSGRLLKIAPDGHGHQRALYELEITHDSQVP